MMDCGFTLAATREKLESRGLSPSGISAICVTHEHDDHIGGVARFAKRYAIPVYVTRGTAQWLPEDFPAVLVRLIDPHTSFAIDGISVQPFPFPTTHASRCNTCSPTATCAWGCSPTSARPLPTCRTGSPAARPW
jgi:glyoxylase-like metal-dependent hydrolase (beta-lactamase superfamily II)